MNEFFKWAYKQRANTVKALALGEKMPVEKLFLSFTSHSPIFISNGPKGLNGAVKGVGFAPKEEFVKDALDDYVKHIKTYEKGNPNYQQRGLEILLKHLYSDEAEKNVDFNYLYGIEMAYNNSYENYLVNPNATLLFYQPPMISYELKGTMELVGVKYNEEDEVSPFDLDLMQQFINAQHDVYHAANPKRWKTRLVYKFKIEEIYNKSAGKNGFGKKVEL